MRAYVRRTPLFAVLLLVPTSILASDQIPHRKSGVWESTMTMPGSNVPPRTMKLCIDAATDSALINMGMSAAESSCSRRDISFTDNQGVIDTVCKYGASTATSHSVMILTGDTESHTETHVQYDPPFLGKTEISSINESKWIGPCPSDMKPGDVVMSNGMKINIDPRNQPKQP